MCILPSLRPFSGEYRKPPILPAQVPIVMHARCPPRWCGKILNPIFERSARPFARSWWKHLDMDCVAPRFNCLLHQREETNGNREGTRNYRYWGGYYCCCWYWWCYAHCLVVWRYHGAIALSRGMECQQCRLHARNKIINESTRYLQHKTWGGEKNHDTHNAIKPNPATATTTKKATK